MTKLRQTRSLGKFILSPNVLRNVALAMEQHYKIKGKESIIITLYETPYKEGKTLGILFKGKGE